MSIEGNPANTESEANGTTAERQFDSLLRLTNLVNRADAGVLSSFALTLADRLTSKTDSSGYTLSYVYDPVGNRTSLSVPSVLSIAYAYDPRNRLTEILGNGNATRFAYDAAGQRTNALWPNGTDATYAYDAAGQLLSLVHATASGTPIASFEYAYDAAGNRTNMTTLEGLHTFAYDNRNQLVGALYPDGSSETFTYDLVGNRTALLIVSTNGSPSTTHYIYGSGNRLLMDEGPSSTNLYAYDGAGRLTNHVVNGQTRTFAYNFQGRMTSLTDIDGSVFAYEFDGEGNRLSQSLNDCLSKRFVYDGADVLLELNPTNGVAYAWVNGPGIDQPIERLLFIAGSPRARRVFHSDALGSVAALTDPEGLPTDTYTYAAFGSLRSHLGPDPNRVTFTAREQLGDSQGWMYYRYRVYLPSSSRFSAPDPIGFTENANVFIYVSNTPLLFTDPYGLQAASVTYPCEQQDVWSKTREARDDGLLSDEAQLARDISNPNPLLFEGIGVILPGGGYAIAIFSVFQFALDAWDYIYGPKIQRTSDDLFFSPVRYYRPSPPPSKQ